MKRFIPILATDFLFWCSTAGLYPLLSRMSAHYLDEAQTNATISNMILSFTVFSLMGRWIVGRSQSNPRIFLVLGTLFSFLALGLYFIPKPWAWMTARAIQGFALGNYAVSIVTVTSTMIPEGKQMKGFAMLGMADFLGFAVGPTISGVLVTSFGFNVAISVFLGLMGIAVVTASRIRPLSKTETQQMEATQSMLAPKPIWTFLPLAAGVFFGILFHIFYANFLPIMVTQTSYPVESIFFAGYVIGGLGFRIKIIDGFERLPGWIAYGLSIVLLAGICMVIPFWPLESHRIDLWVFLSGLGYGLGLEALYIFTLAWVSLNTSVLRRNKVYAMVFSGIDMSNLVAGLTFGVLANLLSPHGLNMTLLWMLPVWLLLPFLLRWLFPNRSQKKLELDH